jgi:hypothetical protein
MSHPHGFRVGWERGGASSSELAWSPGPGGLRLAMPSGGGGRRVVCLALVEGALAIKTRHPRELRLKKPDGP